MSADVADVDVDLDTDAVFLGRPRRRGAAGAICALVLAGEVRLRLLEGSLSVDPWEVLDELRLSCNTSRSALVTPKFLRQVPQASWPASMMWRKKSAGEGERERERERERVSEIRVENRWRDTKRQTAIDR